MQTLKIKAKAEKIKAEKQNRHLFDTMRRNIVTKNEICLETRAKLALMLNLCWTRTYSSLLCIKMWKKNKRQCSEDCMGPMFFYLYLHYFQFFCFCLSRCKYTRWNCAIICCNLPRKHKSALYQTHRGEPNYVDNIIFWHFARSYPGSNLGTDIQIL